MATVRDRGHVVQSIRRAEINVKSGSEWRKSFTKKAHEPSGRTAVVSGRLPPEDLQRGKTDAGKIRCPVGRLSGRPAIKRKRPRQNCIPETRQPDKDTPASGANPYPDYVSKGSENSTKGG